MPECARRPGGSRIPVAHGGEQVGRWRDALRRRPASLAAARPCTERIFKGTPRSRARSRSRGRVSPKSRRSRRRSVAHALEMLSGNQNPVAIFTFLRGKLLYHTGRISTASSQLSPMLCCDGSSSKIRRVVSRPGRPPVPPCTCTSDFQAGKSLYLGLVLGFGIRQHSGAVRQHQRRLCSIGNSHPLLQSGNECIRGLLSPTAKSERSGPLNGNTDFRLDLSTTDSLPLSISSVLPRDARFTDPRFQLALSRPLTQPISGFACTECPRREHLKGKVMAGYQGWFRCPNDLDGGGWVHWAATSRIFRTFPSTCGPTRHSIPSQPRVSLHLCARQAASGPTCSRRIIRRQNNIDGAVV